MERSSKKEKKEDGIVKWKKIGGGSLRIGKKIIKPGEVFSARAEDIPKSFLDLIVALDKIPETEESLKVKKLEYTLETKSAGWFDVYDSNGKKITEKAVRRQAALDLIKTLE